MLGMNLAEKGFTRQFDLIIPVPLHPSRRRTRGFNQSTIFAEGLGEIIGSEIDENIALRKNATTTQTKKDRQLRWSNVQNVFHITDPERLEGKNVLLADDVITTGATIASFGKEVFKCRPASISIATIADVS
jgi:ComF family protein